MTQTQSPSLQQKPVIGFIGLGIMGGSMAAHILAAGYPLHLFSRTRSKAAGLLAQGAHWGGNVAALAAVCDIVITMVGTPQDVEEIYLGENGLLPHARAGTLLIDMTSSSPTLAERIAHAAAARGLEALDAPVTGGDIGARAARLSIMVGGSTAGFARAQGVLACMGSSIVHQGAAGAGQRAKLCNQIAVVAALMGVCEALAFARRAGLDPQTVLQSIGSGAAASFQLQHLWPRIQQGDFAPGFMIKHFVKDLGIALQEARAMQLDLPALELAQKLYAELRDGGHGEQG